MDVDWRILCPEGRSTAAANAGGRARGSHGGFRSSGRMSSLELGERRQNVKIEPAAGACRVDLLLQRAEPDARLAQARNHLDQVGKGPAQPVQLPDDQDVAFLYRRERAAESRAADRRARYAVILEDVLAAGRLEGLPLQVEILFVRRDAGVPNLNGFRELSGECAGTIAATLAPACGARHLRAPGAEPFLLAVVDEDKGVFTIEGPMIDDTPWNHAVCCAQNAGRHVRCFTTRPNRTEARAKLQRSYGWLLSEKPRTWRSRATWYLAHICELAAHMMGICRCDGEWSRDFHVVVRNLGREVGAESGIHHALHSRIAGEAMAQLLRLPGQAAAGLLLVRRGRDRGSGSGTARKEADLADEPSGSQTRNLLLAYSDGRLTL